jgi:hypothetical protein
VWRDLIHERVQFVRLALRQLRVPSGETFLAEGIGLRAGLEPHFGIDPIEPRTLHTGLLAALRGTAAAVGFAFAVNAQILSSGLQFARAEVFILS